MRFITRAVTVVGLLLLVLAGAWKWAAPGQLVKYPTDVDRTFDQVGTVEMFTNPASLTPSAVPAKLPLKVKVRLHVVGTTGNSVIVEEVQDQTIGTGTTAIKARRTLRFVFDRNTMRNVSNSAAYAFGRDHPVDRSPNYAVNFPIHTGDGPYPVWKDETGTTFPMSKVGDAQPVHGVKLAEMKGTMSGVPVADYYVGTLPALVAKQQTLTQLTPALARTHIDPVAVARTVQGSLSPADNATIAGLLGKQVPLKFEVAAATDMIVEPVTGVIVGLGVDQTFSAQPDVQVIAKMQSILAQPRYSNMPNVALAQGLLAKLAANPPASKVLRIQYSSNQASIDGLTDYANSLKKKAERVERTVPLVLLAAGLVLTVMGLLSRLLAGSAGGKDDDGLDDEDDAPPPGPGAGVAGPPHGHPVPASYSTPTRFTSPAPAGPGAAPAPAGYGPPATRPGANPYSAAPHTGPASYTPAPTYAQGAPATPPPYEGQGAPVVQPTPHEPQAAQPGQPQHYVNPQQASENPPVGPRPGRGPGARQRDNSGYGV